MKLFIVDDNQLVRDRLNQLFSSIPFLKVIGWAEDEHEAIEQINELLPDVVLLDLNLRQGSGLHVLTAIKKAQPLIKVMILTNYGDRSQAKRYLQAGADYFFDKHYQFEEVRDLVVQMSKQNEVQGNQELAQ